MLFLCNFAGMTWYIYLHKMGRVRVPATTLTEARDAACIFVRDALDVVEIESEYGFIIEASSLFPIEFRVDCPGPARQLTGLWTRRKLYPGRASMVRLMMHAVQNPTKHKFTFWRNSGMSHHRVLAARVQFRSPMASHSGSRDRGASRPASLGARCSGNPPQLLLAWHRTSSRNYHAFQRNAGELPSNLFKAQIAQTIHTLDGVVGENPRAAAAGEQSELEQ